MLGNVLKRLMMAMAVLSAWTVQAWSQADTLNIRFRLDSIRVDMDYAGNREAWDAFEQYFRTRCSGMSPRSLRLDIYSGASPEGPAAHNHWLGENRGLAIRRLVRQRLGGSVGSIVVHNESARWDGLYELLSASSEPWRDEALRIIEQPAAVDGNQRDQREFLLRTLHGGTAWPVLLEKYLSPLRSGATAVLHFVGGRDTIVVRDTIVLEQPMYVAPYALKAAADSAVARAGEYKPVVRQPAWILRTNIPLLGTGTPNLQAEWSLDHKDRWSVNVEGIWSWWTFSHNAYANEILYGSVEIRRWLGQRYRHHTLDGWHVGLAFGGGYGDLEWKSKGYQAEFYSGFLNIGWQKRFGRRRQWAFDAGVGLGYAYIPWRRYKGSSIYPDGYEEHYDDHLMWQETGHTNWPGAVHANISVGYVFNQKGGAWRRHRALEREAERYDYLHFRDSLMARERFVRDSLETDWRIRAEQADLLPKASRNMALEEIANEKKMMERQAEADRRQAKADAREMKARARAEKKARKQQLRQEKAAYRQVQQEQKRLARTPEGREAARQAALQEKEARRQARIEKREARRQARLDRKRQKIESRMNFEQKRNQERLERELEKADQKYNK